MLLSIFDKIKNGFLSYDKEMSRKCIFHQKKKNKLKFVCLKRANRMVVNSISYSENEAERTLKS